MDAPFGALILCGPKGRDACGTFTLPMTRLTHRGHLQAAALLLHATTESALQAQALALLLPGDRIFAIEARAPQPLRLLVRFASERRLEAALTRGIPLTHDGSLLTSFPLSNVVRAQALEAHAQLVLADAGDIRFAPIGDPVDPSQWLDLCAFQRLPMRSLGAPPPSIAMALTTRDARSVLGRAPLHEDALAAIKALAATPSVAVRSSALLDTAVRTLAAIVRLTQGLFGASSSAPTKPAQLPSDLTPQDTSWLVRKLASWLDALRLRAWQSALGSYLAKKHAEYIARLMELLEQGDVDEALRRAIPLSAAAGGSQPHAPSLVLPSPRADLSISKTRTTGGSLALGDSLYALLKARYRALYDKLIALGRIDDAAFVLAELLDDVLGAVALLEKHGRTREAAELAEARKLEPAILVRQWIIAKNLPRALLLARRHGAFEAAITHLRNEPEARKTLALAWADVRAEAGDYLGALLALELGQALTSVPEIALAWAELAHATGGVHGAVALVWRARLLGTLDGETQQRARTLLHASTIETLALRTAFASALATRSEPFLAPLARLALRTSTRDRALFDQPPASTLEKLEVLGGEGVLRIDRPLIEAPRKAAHGRTQSLSMGARGALAIHDAALLPNGNWLVALGEAGTRLLKPDGATLVAFEAPATKLVLADSGTHALALSFRGELTIVHRIDALRRRIGDAFEVARMTSHASSFDGERWAVVLDGEGHVLDVLRDQPRSLFRVEQCRRVDRALGCISFESLHTTHERLRYDEKGLVLRVRQALPERFHPRLNPHPFQAVYEPIIAMLETREEGLSLTLGAVPHPTPHVFPPARVRGPLSAGRTHIAFSTHIVPQTIARYTLLRPLRSPRGRTHLARVTEDTGSTRRVIVEAIDLSHGPQDIAMDELLCIASLKHRNVVAIHEVGSTDAFHYLATECVHGADLRSLLHRHNQQAMPPAIAIQIAIQICAGLHAAHELTTRAGEPLHIVHRHLAPSKCIVSLNGVVKVRFARLQAEHQGLYAPISIRHVSPEQVRGLALDRRSDLFNVGILLFELLTRESPFRAPTDLDTVKLIRDANAPPIQSKAPHVSDALAAIVHKALAQDRADRWQTAAALRDALRTLQHADESALAAWVHANAKDELRASEARLSPETRPNSSGVSVVNSSTGDIAYRIENAAHTGHRIQFIDTEGETLTLFDDEGRLHAIDLRTERTIGTASIR